MAASSGKNAIAVGNWFGDAWRPNARASIVASAERWKLPVLELTEAIGDEDGHGQKLWLDVHCAGYDRVVWFDRDVLVRHDCPNLFDLVDEGRFGCVSSHQEEVHVREEGGRSLAPLFQENGEPYDFTIDHLNTGVMIFEPAHHAALFANARRFAAGGQWYQFFDEPWLSLAAKQSGVRQLLDKTFNRCGLADWEPFTPLMDDYVWHLCGFKDDALNALIDATIWQAPPPAAHDPIVAARRSEVALGFAQARAQAESWTMSPPRAVKR